MKGRKSLTVVAVCLASLLVSLLYQANKPVYASAKAPVAELTSMSCWSPSGCIVVGSRVTNLLKYGGVAEGGGVAFKTMDGGATWKLLSLPREAGSLNSVDCVSSQRCVITSWTYFGVKKITQQEDFSLTTEDGGGKWFVTKINRDVYDDPVSLSCPAASVCYVATFGSVLKSTNDGRSWKRVFISDGYNTGITCYSEQICEMVSLNRSYRTNNGGRFWQQQAHFPRSGGPNYLACRTVTIVLLRALMAVARFGMGAYS